MVGTFDLENLGDVLFPLVAHHELSRRLVGLELELFSYRSLDPPAWPFKVRPIASLTARLGEFDLLLVGGGHLIRGDAAVAPGYAPSDAVTSHPYGLWLIPTLLAEASGVPVVWNAVGALDSIEPTALPLVVAALKGVDYLAVRDLHAARFVRSLAATSSPVVVPDTVFAIGELLDAEAHRGAAAALADAGVEGAYVVVQPAGALLGHHGAVESIAAAAHARGFRVVELALGPCHDDVPGRLDLETPTARIEPWPAPLAAAAILAGAEAVVAASLHAGVIALASGVPLHRPVAAEGAKHEILDLLPGVRHLPADGDDREVDAAFGRAATSSQVVVHLAALAHHWDEVARHATGRALRGPRPGIAELLGALPEILAAPERTSREALARLTASHEVERWRDAASRAALAEQLAIQRDRVAHLESLLARRSVRVALQLDALRERLRRIPRDAGPDAK